MRLRTLHTHFIDAVISEVDVADETLPPEVRAFVADRIEMMPAHIRAGVHATGLAMGAAVMASTLQSLARVRPDVRASALARWAALPMSPAQQYRKLLRSLVLFAAYEQRLGEAIDTPERVRELAAAAAS